MERDGGWVGQAASSIEQTTPYPLFFAFLGSSIWSFSSHFLFPVNFLSCKYKTNPPDSLTTAKNSSPTADEANFRNSRQPSPFGSPRNSSSLSHKTHSCVELRASSRYSHQLPPSFAPFATDKIRGKK